MSQRPRHGGFALLLTLVLVVLAAAALVGLARRSAEEALQTRAAVEELQRRWAVTSCRATLLGQTETLFKDAERHNENPATVDRTSYTAATGDPPSEVRVSLQLAGIDYLVVLTDEQAKLNVNTLLQGGDPARAQNALQQFIDSACTAAKHLPTIALRPIVATRTVPARSAPLAAYGQIFAGANPQELFPGDTTVGPAQLVTCWGDGTVNIHRAPAAVIRQVCGKSLGRRGVDALIVARDQHPDATLAELLAQTSVDSPHRAEATNTLTDRSTCHGLWVIARDRQRSWYTLAVDSPAVRNGQEGSDTPRTTRLEFTW